MSNNFKLENVNQLELTFILQLGTGNICDDTVSGCKYFFHKTFPLISITSCIDFQWQYRCRIFIFVGENETVVFWCFNHKVFTIFDLYLVDTVFIVNFWILFIVRCQQSP